MLETKIKSRAFQQFSEATNTLANPALQSWKDQGGQVMGYFCSYGPAEIISAAGLLPFRMRAPGSTGTDLADAYVSSINCSFCRHCFNTGLLGECDFVEGVIWLNVCDHVRRIYDNWKRYVKTPYVHILSIPKKTGQPQVEWYRDEITLFKESLEKHFDVEISDERLWEAIRLSNETRRLQRRLYDLRKRKNPPITGAETMAVMVAGTAMPAAHYNELLKQLLDDISDLEGNADYRARVMIVGSLLDDPAYIEVIEGQGGLVVTDMLCFGTKLMWKDVREGTGDPVTALAQYYVAERPHCPRMFGDYPRRAGFVRDMVREFKVNGIIGERMQFCDNWTGEHLLLGKEFRAEGIPYLRLEREYLLAGVGQLRTRVQAFLETMGR